MKPFSLAAMLLVLAMPRWAAAQSEPLSADASAPAETFYQQVDVQRAPHFVLQGIDIRQQIHYRILSSFAVYAPDETGRRRAVQTIHSAGLIEADPLSAAVLARSLAQMQGREFTYTLDETFQVVSMEGHQDTTASAEVKQPKLEGVLVSTVVDEDGWKELAQLTLFQPPSGRSERSFERRTTHDWGSLGSWYGKTVFTAGPGGRNRKRFRYEHQLEYIRPDKDAPQAGDPLPFKVENATFRLSEAQGEIFFDPKRERVQQVREIFHAQGSITTTILGVASTVELEERQVFTIQVQPQRVITIEEKPE